MQSAASIPLPVLESVVHHMFLPPGTPQSADDAEDIQATDKLILRLVGDALGSFRSLAQVAEVTSTIDVARRAIDQLSKLKSDPGNLNEVAIKVAFRSILSHGMHS